MNVLVDSDILIEVLRGRDQDIVDRWKTLGSPSHAVLCSPISICEIWHGARRGEEATIEAVLSSMICVPVDAKIGRLAGDYLRQYSKSHSLEIGDGIIAATTTVHRVALWTRNRRHYPMRDFEFF